MKFHLFLIVSTFLLLLINAVDARVKTPKFNKKGERIKPKLAIPKPAPVVLDLKDVPKIEEILAEVNLSDLFPRLIRMGVTESRLLVRLQPMDYRVMEMEWEEEEGLSDKILQLKEIVQKYYLIAKEAGQALRDAPKLNKDRDKLTYGRLVMKHGVQSFEYALASFGGKVPRGARQLRVAPYPHTGCPPPEDLLDPASATTSSAPAAGNMHSGEKAGEEEDDEEAYFEDSDVSRFLDQVAEARNEEIELHPSDDKYTDSAVDRIVERAAQSRWAQENRVTSGQRAQYDAERIANGTLENLSNIVYAVRRGECTYLDKAVYAARKNASALLIINHLDRIDSPASGLGIDPFITQSQVDRVHGLPIFSMSNTSWPKLNFAVSDRPLSLGNEVYVEFVPLKCGASKLGSRGSGGSSNVNKIERGCDTIEELDAQVQQEVTAGHMMVQTSLPPLTTQEKAFTPTSTLPDASIPITGHAFQFLTSNFGAPLPSSNAPFQLLRAEPIDACTEIQFGGLAGNPLPVALVVDRGKCAFHVKMANVERSGARLAVIINIRDDPLQRIGGELPAAGHIGMPGVLVTAPTGAYLLKAMAYASEHESASSPGYITTTLHPAKDQNISDAWIDLAFYSWERAPADRQLQYQALIGKHSKDAEIAAWLTRSAQAAAAEKARGEKEEEEEEEEEEEKEEEGGEQEL